MIEFIRPAAEMLGFGSVVLLAWRLSARLTRMETILLDIKDNHLNTIYASIKRLEDRHMD